MNATYSLIRLGAASQLTQSGGGSLFLEENMIFPYDPI